MIYPCDAITIPFIINGLETIELLPATSTPRTILNAHIISISEGSFIDAGSVRIAKAYKNEGTDDRQMLYQTTEQIKAGSSGATNAYGQIVYVERDIANSQPVCSENRVDNSIEYIENEGTTTGFYLSKTISYADFLIIIFLLLFTIGAIANFIIRWFIPNRIDLKH
jgi:hypothetical protein